MKNSIYFFLVIAVLIGCNSQKKEEHKKDALIQNRVSGKAFGTSYSITFIAKDRPNYNKAYDSLIRMINLSMSTYHTGTNITRINEGDTTVQVGISILRMFF